jgi:hypothetical protein
MPVHTLQAGHSTFGKDAEASSTAFALRYRLPRNNRTRRTIETVLATPDQTITDAQLHSLVQTFTDPAANRWIERILCARMLGAARLSREQTEVAAEAAAAVLADRLEGDTRDEREAAGLWWPWLVGVPSLMLFYLLNQALAAGNPTAQTSDSVFTDMVTWQTTSDMILGGFALLALAAACLPTLIRAALLDLEDRRILEIRIAAVEALGHLQHPGAVDALAGVLHVFSPRLRWAAKTALVVKALPALTSEHYGTLKPQTILNLCHALDYPDETFALLLLEALGKVGTGRALPFVARIAAHGNTPRLREQAAQVVPILQERQQQETDRRVLLRGSAAPEIDAAYLLRSTHRQDLPEQMLRPVAHTPENAPHLLLRSHPPASKE